MSERYEWQRLAACLPEKGDGVLVTAAPDMRLLTGHHAEGAVMVTKEEACFFTDSRYIEASEKAIGSMPCVCFSRLSDSLRDWCEAQGVRRLFLQAEHMSLAGFARWREALPGVEVTDSDAADGWLTELRTVKSPAQVEAIRAAQKLTDDGFSYILSRIEPGRTEREVALDLEFAIRRAGAEGVAFDFIVVAGENGSLPHGVPGDRVIRKGDLVTMDFGAKLNGWHSDMTRTVAVGEPADWQREIYETVWKAQTSCIAALKAGITCRAGDAVARDLIGAAGYGAFFGHGTGHGVGLEIHESPTLSPRGGDRPLRAGEIVTVEPGIYLPGKGGVRIEDMVLITDEGCEDLTGSPKNLIIL